MADPALSFEGLSTVERLFNRCVGWFVGLGLGLRHNFLLEVRGRKSGRLYVTPVDLLDREGALFLVAPRGETQWVRNARAAGEVTLRKGRQRTAYRLQSVAEAQKPEVLKAYLDCFKLSVQRFFPVAAGSPVEAFEGLAGRYPVFELIRK